VSGWGYYVSAGFALSPESWNRWAVYCPSGKKALGGGVATGGDPLNAYWARVLESAPAGAAATGWTVAVRNESDAKTITEYVWVICANVS
jgi:hypothetical protein